jgi:hypothetical protein
MKPREFCLRLDTLIINDLNEEQQSDILQPKLRVREINPELDSAWAECERALKCSEIFHSAGGVDDCKYCKALEILRKARGE